MAKGHKKIVGSYCYKGNGCTSRFCEFCCNGDKYEEIEDESYLENQYSTNEAIKERIDELIQLYEVYIEQNKRIIESKKVELNEVLNTGKYECSAGYIESIQQYARDIDCYEIFIDSLNYAKTGERK